MEIFDGNVAHISTWLYQAEALLDEIEKKPANKREEIVKVADGEDQQHFWEWRVLLWSFSYGMLQIPCAYVDSLAFMLVG